MSSPETKELVKELESFDPEIGELIKEEKSLLNVIQEKEKRGDNVAELEETVEDAHEETTEKIKDVLVSDPNSLKKVKKLVESRLKEYGGIEKTLERLKNVDLNKVPRLLKKQLRKLLPSLISSLKKRNMSPELIDILEDLKKKVEENLVFTKPKKWWRKKGGNRKTMKKGGNNGDGALFAMGWIAFLITCCCTGVGCIICGPLLVVTFCGLVPELCQGILMVGQAVGNVVVGVGKGIVDVGVGIGKGIVDVGNGMFSRTSRRAENYKAPATVDVNEFFKVKITQEMKETNDKKMGEVLERRLEADQLRDKISEWRADYKSKHKREPREDDEENVEIFKDYKKTTEWLKENNYIGNLKVGQTFKMNREVLKMFDLTPEDLTNKKGGRQTKKQRRHK